MNNDIKLIFEAYKKKLIGDDPDFQPIIDLFKKNYYKAIKDDDYNFVNEDDPTMLEFCDGNGATEFEISLEEALKQILNIKTIRDIKNIYDQQGWDIVYDFYQFISEITKLEIADEADFISISKVLSKKIKPEDKQEMRDLLNI
jgi:hypothetical protein